MVRSLNMRSRDRLSVRLKSAREFLRGMGPLLAVIAGFAVMALLLDFCVVCLWHAIF